VFGTDVYSSDEVVDLDQALLNERKQRVEDAIDAYNDVVIASNVLDDDGGYATISNLTTMTLNVTYRPYEGDNINKVAGKIANCSETTIVLIVIHVRTPSEDQKNRFVQMINSEYASQSELQNSLNQTLLRCTLETIIEVSRVLLYAPYPPGSPPLPFVGEDTLFEIGMSLSGAAVVTLLVCASTGHMILAAFRQAADLIPYWVSGKLLTESNPPTHAANTRLEQTDTTLGLQHRSCLLAGPMSRKAFYIGGIGTFVHVMVWAFAAIVDLLMMNQINRDVQDIAWLYWRFGFGTLIFGFTVFVGAATWHIVSDDMNKFHDGDAPPWLITVMLGCVQVSGLMTALQTIRLDNNNYSGRWNSLVPANGGGSGPDWPYAELRNQHTHWTVLLMLSLSMKVLAYLFLRNNQEWAGPKKNKRNDGVFAHSTVSAIMITFALGLCAAIGVVHLIYGMEMIKEMIVLAVIAAVTLATVCLFGNNRLVTTGRYFDRISLSDDEFAFINVLSTVGVIFGVGAMMIGIVSGTKYVGIIATFVVLSATILSVVACCGPRPFAGLACGKNASSTTRSELASYLSFSIGVSLVVASAFIFALYGDSLFLLELLLAIGGVVTIVVVCFMGNSPLLRIKTLTPNYVPSTDTAKREIAGPTLGTYVLLTLLVSASLTIAFVYSITASRADFLGIVIVVAVVVYFFACCVCGQNLLPWLMWSEDAKTVAVEPPDRSYDQNVYIPIFFALGFGFAAGSAGVFFVTKQVAVTVTLGIVSLLVFVAAFLSGPGIEVVGDVQKTKTLTTKTVLFTYFLTVVAIALATVGIILPHIATGNFTLLRIIMGIVSGTILVVILFCGHRPLLSLPIGRRRNTSSWNALLSYFTFTMVLVVWASAFVAGVEGVSTLVVALLIVLGAVILTVLLIFGDQPLLRFKRESPEKREIDATVGPSVFSTTLLLIGIGLPVAATIMLTVLGQHRHPIAATILYVVGFASLCIFFCFGKHKKDCCTWRYRKYKIRGLFDSRKRGWVKEKEEENEKGEDDDERSEVPLFAEENNVNVLDDGPRPLLRDEEPVEEEELPPALPTIRRDFNQD
jgi:hypothetical protein